MATGVGGPAVLWPECREGGVVALGGGEADAVAVETGEADAIPAATAEASALGLTVRSTSAAGRPVEDEFGFWSMLGPACGSGTRSTPHIVVIAATVVEQPATLRQLFHRPRDFARAAPGARPTSVCRAMEADIPGASNAPPVGAPGMTEDRISLPGADSIRLRSRRRDRQDTHAST
ncbi:hypothetical protein L1085_035580 [Streptomyces sp. MSC1_001]|uniref:hypothetical protein n=1 Tax=Streptomyces sp. MSC1_001 TaxID=2909263 RepID=UPI00202EBB7D|nr:hypothetical protein [Streptomyces sp. MSC1_001]